jgi:hypothetical protein
MAIGQPGPPSAVPFYRRTWALITFFGTGLAVIVGIVANIQTIYRWISPQPPTVGLSISDLDVGALLSGDDELWEWSIAYDITKARNTSLSGCIATVLWPTQDTGGEYISRAYSLPSGSERITKRLAFKASGSLKGNTGNLRVSCKGGYKSNPLSFKFPDADT